MVAATALSSTSAVSLLEIDFPKAKNLINIGGAVELAGQV